MKLTTLSFALCLIGAAAFATPDHERERDYEPDHEQEQERDYEPDRVPSATPRTSSESDLYKAHDCLTTWSTAEQRLVQCDEVEPTAGPKGQIVFEPVVTP